jgi:hypothetical protein
LQEEWYKARVYQFLPSSTKWSDREESITIVEMARSMLKAKSLGNEFWAEAVHTSTCILNRCLTKVVLNLIPEEAWSGHKPSVAHMKVFGCIAYAHVSKENIRKMDDKSVKCIFIGYSTETRSYRLFDPQAKKVIISKDVVFDEQGIYQSELVQLKLKEGIVTIDGEFLFQHVAIVITSLVLVMEEVHCKRGFPCDFKG